MILPLPIYLAISVLGVTTFLTSYYVTGKIRHRRQVNKIVKELMKPDTDVINGVVINKTKSKRSKK